MVTTAAFRKFALSMPDAIEGEHMDHPDFRANGRIFASLHPDGERGMVKVPIEEQRRLVREHGASFEPAQGAWGRAGCTYVRLAAVDTAVLRAAMTCAWETIMAQSPAGAARQRTG